MLHAQNHVFSDGFRGDSLKNKLFKQEKIRTHTHTTNNYPNILKISEHPPARPFVCCYFFN